MDLIPKANVVHRLEKRSLLIAINCIAGLSIFFFGYDQGMMGGVNNAVDYYDTTMKFGHEGPDGSPVIDNTLKQGGIVSDSPPTPLSGIDKNGRSRSITSVLSSVAWSVAGSETSMAASRPLRSVLCGPSSAPPYRPRR